MKTYKLEKLTKELVDKHLKEYLKDKLSGIKKRRNNYEFRHQS